MSDETGEPSVREQRVNAAIAAYLEAADAGQTPDHKEFIAAHSDIAAELQSFFANRDKFERMVKPLQPAAPSGAPGVQYDDVTLPPAGEPTEAPTLAPTKTAGAAVGTTIRYFGDYELLEEIARGGMGVVYKARQVSLNRVVALKMILAGQLASEEDVRRFHAEAEAAANLDHPGIVPIYEVGEHGGHHYFSMGYVEGPSLADKLKLGPLPPREAAQFTRKVSKAIAFAHQRGVIHRDLKPGNVLLDRHGEPKVTDFGLAKKVQDERGLTAAGQILGTPSYMPPEQASGKVSETKEPADIYALGAVLYALLTGRPPFQADNPLDTLLQVLEREPVPPRQLNSSVPKDLETICLKCLEKDPRRRYESARALGDELERFLNDEPILARPAGKVERLLKWSRRRPTAAALVAVSVLAAVALLATILWSNARLSRERDYALEQRDRATEAMAEADRQRGLAEAREAEATRQTQLAESRLYAFTLAQVAATAPAEPGRALALLEDDQRCPLPLREFGWRFFYRFCSRRERLNLHVEKAWVYSSSFRPDGRLLAVACGPSIKVYDPATGDKYGVVPIKGMGPRCLAYSPTGRLLAAGMWDGTVTLWNGDTLGELRTWKADRKAIQGLAWSSDERSLATAGESGAVALWEADSGRPLSHLPPGPAAPGRVACSPDGKRLAVSYRMGSVKLWDAGTCELLATIDTAQDDSGTAQSPDSAVPLAFLADGQALATGSPYQRLKIWEVPSGRPRMSLAGHQGFLTCLAVSTDGKRIASAGGWLDRYGEIKVWDAASGRDLGTLRGHDAQIQCVAFTPDGNGLATGGLDGNVKLWDLATRGDAPLRGPGGQIRALAFSPDHLTLATGGGVPGQRGEVTLWDATSKQPRGSLAEPLPFVSAVAYDPDGKVLATGSWDGAVRLWDAATRSLKATFSSQAGSVTSVVFSPDGRIVAAARGPQIVLHDAQTGQLVRTLEGHKGEILSLAFASASGMLASAAADHSVRLWDCQAGSRGSLDGHTGVVRSVAFSRDGRTLVSASDDRTVRLWEPATGRATGTLAGHVGPVLAAAIAPDGRTVVSGGEDKVVRLWHAATGHELAALPGHAAAVVALAFSPGGTVLASSADDGSVRLWWADVSLQTPGTP